MPYLGGRQRIESESVKAYLTWQQMTQFANSDTLQPAVHCGVEVAWRGTLLWKIESDCDFMVEAAKAIF